jgi:hypothetical protein
MSVHTKLLNSHRTNFRENRYADFQDNLLTKSKFLKSDKSNDIMHEDRRTVTTMALTSSGLPTFLVLLRPQMSLLLTACLLACLLSICGHFLLGVISVFRCGANEVFALLECYAALIGS